MLFRPAFEPEQKIADVVHQLLRDRSVDRAFAFQDNLRDVGPDVARHDQSRALGRGRILDPDSRPRHHAGEFHVRGDDRPPGHDADEHGRCRAARGQRRRRALTLLPPRLRLSDSHIAAPDASTSPRVRGEVGSRRIRCGAVASGFEVGAARPAAVRHNGLGLARAGGVRSTGRGREWLRTSQLRFRSFTRDPRFVNLDVAGIEGNHVGAITRSELAQCCVKTEKSSQAQRTRSGERSSEALGEVGRSFGRPMPCRELCPRVCHPFSCNGHCEH